MAPEPNLIENGPGVAEASPGRRPRWHGVALGIVAVAVVVVIGTLIIVDPGSPGSEPTASRFDLPALSGAGRTSLASFRGRPVVVTLFASWCDTCRAELPGFATTARHLRASVVFIGIDSLETGNGLAMAREYGLTTSGFVLLRDVGPGSSAYHDAIGARGMPATAFYNPQGRLLQVDQGGISEAQLLSTIERLYGVT